MSMETKDVVIVGGGPAGLSAALVLGRSRKRVLLCDAGVRRNERAEHLQGFVTRDGISPLEFRRIGREQLQPYDVELQHVRVKEVERLPSGFRIVLDNGRTIEAAMVLLATGMIDLLPEIPGYREAWGTGIVQCPYCHGWEVKDERFGVHATSPLLLDFALFVTGWSRHVVAFTDGAVDVPPATRTKLERAGVRLEERPIQALQTRPQEGHEGAKLEAIVLTDGTRVPTEVLFARPPQRQVELVERLGLALDEQGFVRIDEHKETSVPGIFAAGDLTTILQGALLAASAGASAAYLMNHRLNVERAARGWSDGGRMLASPAP